MSRSHYRTRIYLSYASTFQGASPVFDSENASTWGKAYQYYLRGWLPESKDAAIADLGCGSGNLLYFFKCHGYSNLSGTDISSDQIQIASQVGVHVLREDAIAFLGSRLGSFDMITAMDIVEHFDKGEILPILDACFAALKPGGRIILQTPNADSPFVTSIRYGDFTHEVCFNANSLGHLLKLSGFQQVEAREQGPVPYGHNVKSSLRYLLWQMLRCGLKFWNYVETGSAGADPLSRVFLISARKAML